MMFGVLLLLPPAVSYDKYYQCAHVWLYGYSESRQPLTQPEILQVGYEALALHTHPIYALNAHTLLHAS